MQAAYLKHEFAIRSHRPDWSFDQRAAALSSCTLRRPVLHLEIVQVRRGDGRFVTKSDVRKLRRAPRVTRKPQLDRAAAARKAWVTIRARQLLTPQSKPTNRKNK